MTIPGITEKEQAIIEKILDNYINYDFFYYGSRKKGNFSKVSDLDILIKGTSQMPLEELEKLKSLFDKSDLPYIVNFADYYSINKDFFRIARSL